MKRSERIQVVLRAWENGDIIALFPYVLHDSQHHCLSYERIGQHGGANYDSVVCRTKPVNFTDQKAQVMLSELRRIGYDPQVIKRGLYTKRIYAGTVA